MRIENRYGNKNDENKKVWKNEKMSNTIIADLTSKIIYYIESQKIKPDMVEIEEKLEELTDEFVKKEYVNFEEMFDFMEFLDNIQLAILYHVCNRYKIDSEKEKNTKIQSGIRKFDGKKKGKKNI